MPTNTMGKKDEPTEQSTENPQRIGRLSIIGLALFAAVIFLLGLFTHKYEITQFLLEERLRMREFMPHFRWWQNTSDVLVTCRIYVFSVTNRQRWLDNLDDRLKFEEIGPITYRETLDHLDVVFHENNSTISYNSRRQLLFMPDHNEDNILNKTITVPNIAVLAMAAKLQRSSSLVKWAFRLILSGSGDDVFVNTTVQNYLWNMTSPVIQHAKKIVPFMVPMENIGVLNVMYQNYNDRVNVRYGKRYGHEQFFMMNSYGSRPTVPGFIPENGDCFASIVNATEGAAYQQQLNEKSVLIYWRKTLCRPVPLYFEKKVHIKSLVGYKYVLLDSSYDRLANLSNDCYKGQISLLENGMTDMSKCFTDFPVVATSPHYYARNLSAATQISGMKPNRESHHSYIVADPSLGIPIDQCARTQSNLFLPKLSNFPDKILKFSEMILPMFWIEYTLETQTVHSSLAIHGRCLLLIFSAMRALI
ncbi:scavenger receptor class B member 1 isoform X2 [Toxorhynchites rutilus septentrionalis]|uniref:scavenger receptor class B member 1 isoform X2 n=1 Tax=Toxorhynchites rutilus septentrionalis TaxID=329112 RepID=UPI00247AA3B5|nr:scavenger receptor class B member 1 isoform X2 [Toxorhynchites rutilus septentrionalis]